MLKKFFYSIFLLNILLFYISCTSTKDHGKELPAPVAENTEFVDYKSYKWEPEFFSQEEIKADEKSYENLFNYGFPSKMNISNVPPTTSEPYAIVDDPNLGRLYITDFPIKNGKNSFSIGK